MLSTFNLKLALSPHKNSLRIKVDLVEQLVILLSYGLTKSAIIFKYNSDLHLFTNVVDHKNKIKDWKHNTKGKLIMKIIPPRQ